MKKLILFNILISLALLINFTNVSAVSDTRTDTILRPSGEESITLINPLKTETFSKLIDRIVDWLLLIGAPILTLMIIIGAFQIMTAGGVPEKAIIGRKTITYAVFGYALLLLSKSLILIIKQILGVSG